MLTKRVQPFFSAMPRARANRAAIGRRGLLNDRSPEFYGRVGAAFRLQQVDAVPVAGEQLDPAVWQGLGEHLLLRRGNRAVVAAEQQDRRLDARQ